MSETVESMATWLRPEAQVAWRRVHAALVAAERWEPFKAGILTLTAQAIDHYARLQENPESPAAQIEGTRRFARAGLNLLGFDLPPSPENHAFDSILVSLLMEEHP